jgi:hypothetical protein
MGRILIRNAIIRRPGYLYYIDGQGNLCEAELKKGGEKNRRWKKKRKVTE